MLKDFREFALRGNVVDLAVGVIIGAAFGKIVTGVVDDLIMPLVGLLLPAGNWREAGLTIGHKPNPATDAAVLAAHPTVDIKVAYGHLLGVTIDFLIVAFVLFLIVRAAARFKARAPETTRECPACREPVAKAARRCRYCTEALTPV